MTTRTRRSAYSRTEAGGTARCAAVTSPTGPGTSARPPAPLTAQRIARIDAELAVLARDDGERAKRRTALDARTRQIGELLRTSPRTLDLHAARRLVADAVLRATRSASRADEEAARARRLRASWVAELSTHQGTCAHLGLPAETAALEGAVAAARRAQDQSAQLGREFTRLAERAQRHAEQLRRTGEAATVRDAAELTAEERWSAWHDAASELAAQHAAIDLPLERARIELAQTRAARDRADRDHRAAEKAAAELGPRLGTIRTLSEGAVETSVGRPPSWPPPRSSSTGPWPSPAWPPQRAPNRCTGRLPGAAG